MTTKKTAIQQIAEVPARYEYAELRIPVLLGDIRTRLAGGVTRLAINLERDDITVVTEAKRTKKA